MLEKRLGIAQLCLLLLVLVFMGLTRGEARLELPPPPTNLSNSVREWGRRNLSFSNSWVGRLTIRSRSNTPVRKPPPLRLSDGIGETPSSGCNEFLWTQTISGRRISGDASHTRGCKRNSSPTAQQTHEHRRSSFPGSTCRTVPRETAVPIAHTVAHAHCAPIRSGPSFTTRPGVAD